jgi:hypothetical protein
MYVMTPGIVFDHSGLCEPGNGDGIESSIRRDVLLPQLTVNSHAERPYSLMWYTNYVGGL